MSKRFRVNVLGLGYVGVATSCYLGALGNEIHGWDVDGSRVAQLSRGVMPFPDADLIACFKSIEPGNLHFVEAPGDFPRADLWAICVGTPTARDGSLQIEDVVSALRMVLRQAWEVDQKDPVILVKSTLSPGSARLHLLPELERTRASHPGFEPELLLFPEFIREGSSIADSRDLPLHLVGGVPPHRGVSRTEEVYRLPEGRLLRCSFETAESVKLWSNAFHALKISFANEASSLCRSLGIDGVEMMRLFAEDRKLNISDAYLRPGFSFGGPCLEKDLSALNRLAEAQELELPVLSSVLKSNRAHYSRALLRLRSLARESESVGFLGLGFKSESTDLRSSPALALLLELQSTRPAQRLRYFLEPGIEPGRLPAQADPTLDELVKNCDVLVLGPSRQARDGLSALLSFHGPILDLMYDETVSKALAGRAGYHRIC